MYCPRCEEVYRPRSARHDNIDGASFGTVFANLFFLVFPELKPPKNTDKYAPRVFGYKLHKTWYQRSMKASKEEQERYQKQQRELQQRKVMLQRQQQQLQSQSKNNNMNSNNNKNNGSKENMNLNQSQMR